MNPVYFQHYWIPTETGSQHTALSSVPCEEFPHCYLLLLSLGAGQWFRLIVVSDIRREWLSALACYQDTFRSSHSAVSNLQGRRCLQSGVNGLSLRAWIQLNRNIMQRGFQPCLCKASVKILLIIYLFWCSTVWSGAPTAPSHRNSPSANTHICQARTPLLPPPPMEMDCRKSHRWGGASSLLASSGFRPLVCQVGCSSIMWCGITTAELLHHLQ